MSNTASEKKEEKLSIHKKLLRAQQLIGVALKDTTNPYFNSKYADYNAIMAVAKSPLNETGLYISHIGKFIDNQYCVVTQVTDEEGNSVDCAVPVVYAKTNDPQAQGSAITYARRYGLSALLAIETEDDDGNKASTNIKVAADTNNIFTEEDELPFDEYDDLGAVHAIEQGNSTFKDKYGKDNYFDHPYIGKCKVEGCGGLLYKNDKGWTSCNNYKSHPKKN